MSPAGSTLAAGSRSAVDLPERLAYTRGLIPRADIGPRHFPRGRSEHNGSNHHREGVAALVAEH